MRVIRLKNPLFLELAKQHQKCSKKFRSVMAHKRFFQSGWTILVVFSTVRF